MGQRRNGNGYQIVFTNERYELRYQTWSTVIADQQDIGILPVYTLEQKRFTNQ